jgi:hypothetical protein
MTARERLQLLVGRLGEDQAAVLWNCSAPSLALTEAPSSTVASFQLSSDRR